MRVALVSAQISPSALPGEPGWNAEVVQVHELADALAAEGHEVTVLARRDDPARPATVRPRPGLTVHHLDTGSEGPAALARRIHERWRSDPPDVVHALHRPSVLAVEAAARDLGVAVVATLARPARAPQAAGAEPAPADRGRPASGGAGPPGRHPAEQGPAPRVDRVVARSEEELRALLRLGVPRSRLRLVPACVDTELWRPDGPALRRTARPRLLSLATPAAGGGVDETIEALRGVPEAELFVAGGPAPGPAADGDADLARLHALAARAGVTGRVRFLGAVPRADVPRLLRSSDALVDVPRWDSSGTAALEAMACGRAVVGTAVGALRDTVVDEVTGLLVLPGRRSELVAALRGALAAPATCTAFGIAGQDRVTSRFARPRIVHAMTEVYREAIGAAAAPEGAPDGSVAAPR